MSERMRVLGLHAENVKRIKVVNLTPKTPLVEIAGDNGNGKTSVLDALDWAIRGKSSKVQWMPVRKGTERARIKLTIGDKAPEFIITRTFTVEADEKVVTEYQVESVKAGRAINGPKAFLDTLFGPTSLDPVAFGRMKPSERIDVVKGLVPGIDFAEMAAARQEAYDERRDVNREAETLRRQLLSFADVPEDASTEEEDAQPVFDELVEVADKAKMIEAERTRRAMLDREVEDYGQTILENDDKVLDLETQIANVKAESVRIRAESERLQRVLAKLPPLEEPPSVADLQARLSKISYANALVARAKRKAEIEEEAATKEEASEKLTAAMDAIDKKVAAAVAAAKLPAGLSLADEDVMLRGVPFDQASDAEQLRASVALAMAHKPPLRVVRIRDGSLLDKKAMGVLADVAERADFQIWIERVDPSSPDAIIMVDGEVSK